MKYRQFTSDSRMYFLSSQNTKMSKLLKVLLSIVVVTLITVFGVWMCERSLAQEMQAHMKALQQEANAQQDALGVRLRNWVS